MANTDGIKEKHPPSKGHRVDTFVMPPEKHVSVDSHELKMAIKNRLDLQDRPLFEDLCKLMEGVANFDFFDLKDRMRKNILPFATGARNSIYLQRSSKSLPTTAALDQKEEEFVADVYEVLRASHYTLLTKEEWGLATSENFNLNLPMQVHWEYMDKDLLHKFWQSSPERKAIRANLPDVMADRILVFHRGVGTEKLSGLLIDQKLDLLMDYTVFFLLDKVKEPLMKVVQQLKDKVMKKKKTPEEEQTEAAAKAAEAAAAAAAAAANYIPDNAAMGHYEFDGNTMIGSKHKFAKSVERKTLARHCPTLLTLLKAFPTSLELQEPTFKDIVVVYRRTFPPRKPPAASANAPNKSKDERMQGILQYRNINIKVFGETPMADVEMIFPEKIVGIKPFQLVNLAITVITALVTGALVLWKAGSDINMNVVWSAASLVLMRCFTVYTTAQTQRTMLQQQMTSTLYDKMQDSQEGVVSVIMEEMADQQLKQMLLAYMLLTIKGRPLLHDDLDNACEDFLYKEFDHPIDYDLDAALPRLRRWGLVHNNAQGKLEAVPMSEAVPMLEAAWASAYKVIGSESSQVPTIDMITGNFSVFGAGIDKFVQDRDTAAAAGAAAKLKGGIVGSFSKATGGVTAVTGGISSGISSAGSSITAGFGKAKGIFAKDKDKSSGGAIAATSVPSFKANSSAAGPATAGDMALDIPEGPATPADAPAASAFATNNVLVTDSNNTALVTADSKHNGSIGGVYMAAVNGSADLDSAGISIESPLASPESSMGGVEPRKKKESSFKKLFKSKKLEA